MSDAPPLIGPEQVALMTGQVSIIVASRDARLQPHLMRAAGCRVAPDLRRVTLLVPEASGRALLDDLRTCGRLAVVFTQPSTNRTLQLKGDDAVVAPCGPDDAALAAQYLRGFVDEVGQLGFPALVAHTIVGQGEPQVAVHFSIAAAFDQTPGPTAGAALCPRVGDPA